DLLRGASNYDDETYSLSDTWENLSDADNAETVDEATSYAISDIETADLTDLSVAQATLLFGADNETETYSYSISDFASAITTALTDDEDPLNLSEADTITHTNTDLAGEPGATGTNDVIDIFVFSAAMDDDGSVTINMFEAGEDTPTDIINLSAIVDLTFEDLTIDQSGIGDGNVSIEVDIGDGNTFTIELTGVTGDGITADHFVFFEVVGP
ncbi:hypothetical protein H0A73_21105, partial [Alcaligenaceae bacterium]|nr:hypothetical protein [Alcaligenaceae bacterium]